MLHIIALIATATVTALLLLCLRLIAVLPKNAPNPKPNRGPAATCIVLGSGGHSAEMLLLLRSLSPKAYFPRTYFVAEGDSLSAQRCKDFENDYMPKTEAGDYCIIFIPRARQVGQSWLTTPFTVLKAFAYTLLPMWRRRPGVVLCNGPGTCVPFYIIGYLFRIAGLFYPRFIYVESLARVKTLSLTGKIVYPLTDLFLVQWPQLVGTYPRAQYRGVLV